MTDRPWVAKFSELCGLGLPHHIPPQKSGYKDVWQKTIKGLRALIILKDVLPYLMGEKLREAQAAIDFFSSTGYRKGKFRPADVWTPASFPLQVLKSARSLQAHFLSKSNLYASYFRLGFGVVQS